MEYLFVYGTLMPGRENAHYLESIAGDWCRAQVRGDLYDSGWRAARGYPGLILRHNAELVSGYLLSSHCLGGYWQRLDDFEGEGYQRVLTSAILADGSKVDAFVYELSPLGRLINSNKD